MKKIFYLLIVIILSLSLFNGCAPTTTPSSVPPPPGEGEEEPTGDRVVLVELFNTEGCAASKVITQLWKS